MAVLRVLCQGLHSMNVALPCVSLLSLLAVARAIKCNVIAVTHMYIKREGVIM
jgi:hypothetical protein